MVGGVGKDEGVKKCNVAAKGSEDTDIEVGADVGGSAEAEAEAVTVAVASLAVDEESGIKTDVKHKSDHSLVNPIASVSNKVAPLVCSKSADREKVSCSSANSDQFLERPSSPHAFSCESTSVESSSYTENEVNSEEGSSTKEVFEGSTHNNGSEDKVKTRKRNAEVSPSMKDLSSTDQCSLVGDKESDNSHCATKHTSIAKAASLQAHTKKRKEDDSTCSQNNLHPAPISNNKSSSTEVPLEVQNKAKVLRHSHLRRKSSIRKKQLEYYYFEDHRRSLKEEKQIMKTLKTLPALQFSSLSQRGSAFGGSKNRRSKQQGKLLLHKLSACCVVHEFAHIHVPFNTSLRSSVTEGVNLDSSSCNSQITSLENSSGVNKNKSSSAQGMSQLTKCKSRTKGSAELSDLVVPAYMQPKITDMVDKEAKRLALTELISYVNTPGALEQFSRSGDGSNKSSVTIEVIVRESLRMVCCNIIRETGSLQWQQQNKAAAAKLGGQGIGISASEEDADVLEDSECNNDDCEDNDDDVFLDPAWPHLQLVYEYLLSLASCPDVKPKVIKKYFIKPFLRKLLLLFSSPDPRERNFLKAILHRIYGKVMPLRIFLRYCIREMFFNTLYVEPSGVQCGMTEILEVLASIINGFTRPVKAEHLDFLERVLLPLHALGAQGMPRKVNGGSMDKSNVCVNAQDWGYTGPSRISPNFITPEMAEGRNKGLAAFSAIHHQLAYCTVQYVAKEPQLIVPVLCGLLRFWPRTSSAKQLLFLEEMEEAVVRCNVIPKEDGTSDDTRERPSSAALIRFIRSFIAKVGTCNAYIYEDGDGEQSDMEGTLRLLLQNPSIGKCPSLKSEMAVNTIERPMRITQRRRRSVFELVDAHIAQLLRGTHFQVAERTLLMFNNNFVVRMYREAAFMGIISALSQKKISETKFSTSDSGAKYANHENAFTIKAINDAAAAATDNSIPSENLDNVSGNSISAFFLPKVLIAASLNCGVRFTCVGGDECDNDKDRMSLSVSDDSRLPSPELPPVISKLATVVLDEASNSGNMQHHEHWNEYVRSLSHDVVMLLSRVICEAYQEVTQHFSSLDILPSNMDNKDRDGDMESHDETSELSFTVDHQMWNSEEKDEVVVQ